MAKTNRRPSHQARTTQAQHSKARLLPLPRAASTFTALRAHLALDLLRRGKGNASSIRLLADVMCLVVYMVELGYCTTSQEPIDDADRAVARTVDWAGQTGEWRLDERGVAAFAPFVTAYDKLLEYVPVGALATAYDALDRIRARSAEVVNRPVRSSVRPVQEIGFADERL
jgi:hypothetical protein